MSDFFAIFSKSIIQNVCKDIFKSSLFPFHLFPEEAGVKYNTVLNWERSRNEQNLYQQKIKENIQEKSIREKRKLIKNEKIASNEMLKFYLEHMKVSEYTI